MIVSIRTLLIASTIFFKSVSNVHQYGTRQASKNDIFLTRKNTLQYDVRSVRFSGAKSWNSIPVDIKRSSSFFSFRHKLRAFLFMKYNQS